MKIKRLALFFDLQNFYNYKNNRQKFALITAETLAST